ncbi:FAD/NAD(P)-binding domain-containing protein [Rhizopogon salebrosus TDB-379]|nr:FAD/NAD(P)-binding domain-containing protein [Rhizopogon salebrosus TDB-379]
MSPKIPKHAQIVVVGGGPSGSYAASALAREGLEVVLLEAAHFPRYHVGESLIPSVRHCLRFIDAEQKLVDMGFKHKPGAAMKFNQFKREGYTDFVALGHSNSAWNVVRSTFDKMLLDHATSCGTKVFEQTRVKSLQFSTTDPSRPVAAEWFHAADGETGVISFDYLVDASGRSGLMSTKYLRNRHFNASLKNIALWGYWLGVSKYGMNTPREGAPWFETLTDQSGWAWFIPLHDGTTSIGVVMNQAIYNEKVRVLKSNSLEDRYRCFLSLAPGLVKLLGCGRIVQKEAIEGQPGQLDLLIRSASDFSYSASSYGGPGFRLVGDAGAFIDPFFSSGIHLAMTSGLSAAVSICAAVRGDCSEVDAAAWHTKRFSLSYTRFQMVVMSAYKQIRSTDLDILNDVDEDNYDRAFAAIRPVIQGASEMGSRLSEKELDSALEFCSKCFNPASPEHLALASKQGLPKDILDVTAPFINPQVIESAILKTSKHMDSKADQEFPGSAEDLKLVLDQINGRRVVHREYTINNFEVEDVNGFVVRLRKGCLGLTRTSTMSKVD